MKTKKRSIFTVDWEVFNSFDHHSKWDADSHIDEPTHYLLDLLNRHKIKAIWYCVGWLEDHRTDLYDLIRKGDHLIGDHTYYHRLPDIGIISDVSSYYRKRNTPYRNPRWRGERRLYSGGFWFRAMPYWWVKKEVEKTGVFFVHPHDVLFEHPDVGWRNFDRNLGLKTSRDKLERLCREITWNEPNG